METSAQTLLVSGMAAVFVGLLLGVPLGRERTRAPTASPHLVNTHLEALIGGATLLGLSVAAAFSELAAGLEVAAAWLLVGGVGLSIGGGTMNWLAATGDQFAARSPGFLLQATGGPLMLAGGAILAAGVALAV